MAIIRKRGRVHTSSFEEEVAAMGIAAAWAATECSAEKKVVVCTDSQSLCQALEGSNPSIDDLRSLLSSCQAPMVIQWIPGHSEVPGNVLVDKAAKETCKLDEDPAPVSYGSACALIKSAITDGQPIHQRAKAVYSGQSASRDNQLTTRADQVLLARIRSGHHMALRAYKNRIDGVTDPSCPRCKHPEHTLEHWMLECPEVLEVKNELWGETETGLEVLGTHPREAITLARRTLLGVQPT